MINEQSLNINFLKSFATVGELGKAIRESRGLPEGNQSYQVSTDFPSGNIFDELNIRRVE